MNNKNYLKVYKGCTPNGIEKITGGRETPYWKTDKQVYYFHQLLNGADPKTFKVAYYTNNRSTNYYFGYDKKNLYIDGLKIPGIKACLITTSLITGSFFKKR